MAMPAYSLAEQGGEEELLPYVGRGVVRTLQLAAAEVEGSDGSFGLDIAGTYREWTLPFGKISDAQYEALERWHNRQAPPDGHGLGPFELRERGNPPVLVEIRSLNCGVQLFGRVEDATMVLRQANANAVG